MAGGLGRTQEREKKDEEGDFDEGDGKSTRKKQKVGKFAQVSTDRRYFLFHPKITLRVISPTCSLVCCEGITPAYVMYYFCLYNMQHSFYHGCVLVGRKYTWVVRRG